MLNHTEGNLITENILELVLPVYQGKNKIFDMNVVVGKEVTIPRYLPGILTRLFLALVRLFRKI